MNIIYNSHFLILYLYIILINVNDYLYLSHHFSKIVSEYKDAHHSKSTFGLSAVYAAVALHTLYYAVNTLICKFFKYFRPSLHLPPNQKPRYIQIYIFIALRCLRNGENVDFLMELHCIYAVEVKMLYVRKS